KQRDAAVRFQAAEAIAMPLDEAVLDHQLARYTEAPDGSPRMPVGPPATPLDAAVLDHQLAGYTEAPDGSPRMQVVLVAARRSMIEGLLDAAKQAGLKPEGVDLDAFALVRMLAVATDTI